MPRRERRKLHGEVLAQVNEQLEGQRRNAFRGHVAVDLELELPIGRHAAKVAPVVKGYLDVLGESAFYDAFLDGAKRDALTVEIAQLGQIHTSEFERFATRHPELDDLTALIEAA